MASYTIEDIELIRRKSGISYQEAVALLDYHNGNVARALVDLERNGRIKPETAQKVEPETTDRNKKGFMNLMTRLYRFRLKVKKGSVTILNLSLLFSLLALIISPHLVIIGAILMLVLGYHVSFDKRDADFASENLERMVRNAGENVKDTVNDFTRGFESAFSGEARQESKPADQAQQTTREVYEKMVHDAGKVVKQTFNEISRSFEGASSDSSEPQQPADESERSYYASNPAAMTHSQMYDPAASVPTLQVPMQVESQDGDVRLESDKDGFNSATVE